MIEDLDNIEEEYITTLLPVDENGRRVNVYHLRNAQLCSISDKYPNIRLSSFGKVYNPIRERVMSLKDIQPKESIVSHKIKSTYSCPVFFFCYNFDNYYHFVYDTLPYLITYKKLKENTPKIKLLMNYPTHANKFYKFVDEFLELFGIEKNDILLINKNTIYKNVYISSSYTHDINSDLPPRKEIFNLYSSILPNKCPKNVPQKIYVSRRSWIHNNLENIGTNYTTRRKLINENDFVMLLEKMGFVEVFTENMNIKEKINLFNGCDQVIGAIGGGLCNVLFSQPNKKLVALVSPTFLETNNRFKYCLSGVHTNFYEKTFHTEKNFWKKYMRASHVDSEIVGEVLEIGDDSLVLACTDENVSGWNSSLKLNKIEVPKEKCKALDKGLNSSWTFDINDFKNFLEMTL
jgi:hypothetical protein